MFSTAILRKTAIWAGRCSGRCGVNCSVLQKWRRGWDSNPRLSFPNTRFPSVLLKPLGHLSGWSEPYQGNKNRKAGIGEPIEDYMGLNKLKAAQENLFTSTGSGSGSKQSR